MMSALYSISCPWFELEQAMDSCQCIDGLKHTRLLTRFLVRTESLRNFLPRDVRVHVFVASSDELTARIKQKRRKLPN